MKYRYPKRWSRERRKVAREKFRLWREAAHRAARLFPFPAPFYGRGIAEMLAEFRGPFVDDAELLP